MSTTWLIVMFVTETIAVNAACHTTSRYQDTRRGDRRLEIAPGTAPRALPPSMEVSDDGRFRFVEPFVCAMQSVTEMAEFDVETRRANLATIVVGVITTALGAVATATALTADDPAESSLAYLGPAGLVVGMPLVVAPLFGNTTSRVPGRVQEVRAAAGEEPCGTKPLPGRRAAITWNGLRVVGGIDADGYFAVSPFSFVDAFDIGRIPALVLNVEIERDAGTLPLEIVLDAAALAGASAGYFRRLNIDATTEALRKVPRLEAGALQLSRVGRDPARGVRVVLPLANNGPGPAYRVRVSISAANPELDGRFIYVGILPAKTSIVVDAVIPVSTDADRALATGDTRFSVRVLDAHGTAPDVAIPFRGTVLNDPSRSLHPSECGPAC